MDKVKLTDVLIKAKGQIAESGAAIHRAAEQAEGMSEEVSKRLLHASSALLQGVELLRWTITQLLEEMEEKL